MTSVSSATVAKWQVNNSACHDGDHFADILQERSAFCQSILVSQRSEPLGHTPPNVSGIRQREHVQGSHLQVA